MNPSSLKHIFYTFLSTILNIPRRMARISKPTITALLILTMSLPVPRTALAENVPADANLRQYITNGFYDLNMLGNATWSSELVINQDASGLIINGNGYTLVLNGTNGFLRNFNYNNNNAAVRYLTITPGYAGSQVTGTTTESVVRFESPGITSTLDLTGSIFTAFNRPASQSGLLWAYGGDSGNLANVTIISGQGESDRLTFLGNRGQTDNGAVGVHWANVTFTGDVLFQDNWTGNYGPAVNTYETNGSLTFQGRTDFVNNRAHVFGGAVDVWGGSFNLNFDGETTFDGNYVFQNPTLNTWDIPYHETGQIARAGALNMGYVPTVANVGATVTFNAPVSFTNNRAISILDGTNNSHAYGGAICSLGEGTYPNYASTRLHNIYFNDSAIFDGNYVYSQNGVGYGGAIYWWSLNNNLTFNSGTQFTNNYAKTLGGAIYLKNGSITLNADGADILFRGNRINPEYNADYSPVAGTGTPNAIYVDGTASLNLNAAADRKIEFYDPMSTALGQTVTVNKSGAGNAILYGDNGATSDYDWNIQANTTVQGGSFTLADGVKYGTAATDTIVVEDTGTLDGSNGGEVRALAVVIRTGGSLGAAGGLFNVNAGTISLLDGAYLVGFGTLGATSNMYLNGTVFADIEEDETLNVTALLTGTGGINKIDEGTLTLSAANTYSGSTTVSAGTLQGGIANAFAQSGSVSVSAGATLDLNDFNQTAQNLSGAGNVVLGAADLTVINSTDTIFSGQIGGTGGLTKTGGNSLTLSGTNTYSGGTNISQGTLIATDASALGSGNAIIDTVLNLAFSSDGTMVNNLSGTGTLLKSGTTTATLTADQSNVAAADVQAGTLSLQQDGTFTAGTYTTRADAVTTLGSEAYLVVTGTFTQEADATLNIDVGDRTDPMITADNADIGGILNVTGINSPDIPDRASELDENRYIVISTLTGIANDFDQVNLDGLTSPVDYLTYDGRKSTDGLTYSVGLGLTWYSGAASGDGVFTLEDDDSFEVDVVLADRTGLTFASLWDGASLTKDGTGTLILSRQNTYTGTTEILAGTLQTDIDDAFAQSAAVSVASGATLNLNDKDQIAQNIAGAGTITLGSAELEARIATATATEFSGNISGTGSLVKTGDGSLTLSGQNGYSGGTTVNAGTLVATTGGAVGGGAVEITDPAAVFELNFASGSTLGNQLTGGTGTVLKSGIGTATLTGANSNTGEVDVTTGTLSLAQNGVFRATGYTTRNGAATSAASGSRLNISGDFVQEANSTLTVTLDTSTNAIITAVDADIDGDLYVNNFSVANPASASQLQSSLYTIIDSQNAIQGEFDRVFFGSSESPVDYLTISGGKYDADTTYKVGMILTWLAGTTLGNGIFTVDTDNTFTVDVLLADQDASATGWTGDTLTKNGAGILILTEENSYSGATIINGGILRAAGDEVFAGSSSVTVNTGGTLDVNNTLQTAQNLSGSGAITLGSGTLTADINNGALEFSGAISGGGSLVKSGAEDLTLSGQNTYSGGTGIEEGRLIATSVSSVGSGDISVDAGATLEIALDANGSLGNSLGGAGTLEKTGQATLTLTADGSSIGEVDVQEGTLSLAAGVNLNAVDYVTREDAFTMLAADATLTLSGDFTQEADSTLTIEIGNTQPIIIADSADLDGLLNIAGFTVNNGLRASDLEDDRFTIIETQNGISNDFAGVSFGYTESPADYLVVDGQISADNLLYTIGLGLTWYAGTEEGDGTFTLSTANDAFIVDVALNTESGTFESNWDGNSLTKEGAGTLTLEAVNGYTGSTTVNGGNLVLATTNTIASSGSVTIGSGAAVTMQNNQILQNLSGEGSLSLGGSQLTARNTLGTTFDGSINGSGNLLKDGSGDLTLTGDNTYSGGTAINAGRIIATQGTALGTGAVSLGTTLVLDFDGDSAMSNQLNGSGTLIKTGDGRASLTGSGSSVGTVSVQEGTLELDGSGVFTASAYTTNGDAKTHVGPNTRLTVNGLYEQAANSILCVEIGSYNPIIIADQARIDGDLNIAAFTAGNVMKASDVVNTQFTIIQSTANIQGDFDNVNFGDVGSGADYLVVEGSISNDQKQYNVGLGLTWYASQQEGDGVFTLTEANESFEIDLELTDRTGPFDSGWNGEDLTKKGLGTLILSAENTYSGITTVNAGTLSLEHDTALGTTSLLDIAGGATVLLNDTEQTVGSLETASGSTLSFDGGSLTISATQRDAADASGGTIQGGTLAGSGTLALDASNVDVLGANTGFSGDVSLSGGSELTMTNAAGAGSGGSLSLAGANDALILQGASISPDTGTLAKDISGSGEVRTLSSADVRLAGDNSGFSGLFDIGSGTTLRADSAARLGSADLTVDGTLVLTATSDWTLENEVTGPGQVVKQGPASLVVHEAMSAYSGATSIEQGALLVGDSSSGGTLGSGQVEIGTEGALSGSGTVTGRVVNQGGIYSLNALTDFPAGQVPSQVVAGTAVSNLTIGSLENSGVIHLAGQEVGNTLTVTGGLVSQGGSLVVNTVLGGDNSPTDRLILDGGNARGNTDLVVRNRNGDGDQTNIGILVIEAINGATTDNGAFSLSSASTGYRSTDGTIAAGAYDYSLIRGGNGGQAQSWYLTSLLRSEDGGGARPEAGAYLANREAAEMMFTHRMHDRLTGYLPVKNPKTGETGPSSFWARVDGNTRKSYASAETIKTDTDTMVFQAGVDLFTSTDPAYGNFRTGLMFGAGTSDSRSKQSGGTSAKSNTDGYAVGLYATWFQDEGRKEGLYADTWIQHGWYENTVDGSGLPKESYDTRLWSASLEAGYTIPLYQSETSTWSLEPSAQVIYNRHSSGNFREENGTQIKQDSKENVTVRAGARFQGRKQFDEGPALEPYVEAYWWHNDKQAGIRMDNDFVRSDLPRNHAEIGAGMGMVLRENLSLTLGVSTHLGENSYRQYGGQLGLRLEW